jgi:cytochrome oxidase Cu insertion factor (SCO1/SenC/PrrC family)
MVAKNWIWPAILAGVLLTACRAATAGQAPLASPAASTALETSALRELGVGDAAPDFALPDQNRQDVTLSQFRGRTVQLAFYVWAFSGG